MAPASSPPDPGGFNDFVHAVSEYWTVICSAFAAFWFMLRFIWTIGSHMRGIGDRLDRLETDVKGIAGMVAAGHHVCPYAAPPSKD